MSLPATVCGGPDDGDPGRPPADRGLPAARRDQRHRVQGEEASQAPGGARPLLASPAAVSRAAIYSAKTSTGTGRFGALAKRAICGQERTVQNFRQRDVRGVVEFTRPPTKTKANRPSCVNWINEMLELQPHPKEEHEQILHGC